MNKKRLRGKKEEGKARHIPGDFPGGAVAKTWSSQCQGPGFDPWSGNLMPHAATKSSHATN